MTTFHRNLGMFLLVFSAASVSAEAAQRTLTLADAIAQALRQSPRLEIAQDQVTAARLDRRASNARFIPRLAPTIENTTTADGLTHRSLGVAVSQLLPTGAELQGSISTLRQ